MTMDCHDKLILRRIVQMTFSHDVKKYYHLFLTHEKSPASHFHQQQVLAHQTQLNESLHTYMVQSPLMIKVLSYLLEQRHHNSQQLPSLLNEDFSLSNNSRALPTLLKHLAHLLRLNRTQWETSQ